MRAIRLMRSLPSHPAYLDLAAAGGATARVFCPPGRAEDNSPRREPWGSEAEHAQPCKGVRTCRTPAPRSGAGGSFRLLPMAHAMGYFLSPCGLDDRFSRLPNSCKALGIYPAYGPINPTWAARNAASSTLGVRAGNR